MSSNTEDPIDKTARILRRAPFEQVLKDIEVEEPHWVNHYFVEKRGWTWEEWEDALRNRQR